MQKILSTEKQLIRITAHLLQEFRKVMTLSKMQTTIILPDGYTLSEVYTVQLTLLIVMANPDATIGGTESENCGSWGCHQPATTYHITM